MVTGLLLEEKTKVSVTYFFVLLVEIPAPVRQFGVMDVNVVSRTSAVVA